MDPLPERLFHGTNERFAEFSREKSPKGFCFTPRFADALEWAEEQTALGGEPLVYEVKLDLGVDPLEVFARRAHWSEIPSPFDKEEGEEREIDSLALDAEARGYEGVIFRKVMDRPDTMDGKVTDTYFVFAPDQVEILAVHSGEALAAMVAAEETQAKAAKAALRKARGQAKATLLATGATPISSHD